MLLKYCAPNLTSLFIFGVVIVNENHNTSTTVKFDFPLLETFLLRAFKWLNAKYVELHAPLLTTFSSEPRNFDCVDYEYSVVILAPRLAMFTCGNCPPEKFIMDGSTIVSANLRCDGETLDNLELLTNIGIRVRNLLNGFNNLEELQLSDFISKVSRLGPPLQCHDNLRRLTLLEHSNPEELLEFLHAAPSLKYLKIVMCDFADYDYGAMGSVPSCIVSHLEEVDFDFGFLCEEAHYNLLKFLLKNGEKLKKLIFLGMSPVMQNEVKEFVSDFRNVELAYTFQWCIREDVCLALL